LTSTTHQTRFHTEQPQSVFKLFPGNCYAESVKEKGFVLPVILLVITLLVVVGGIVAYFTLVKPQPKPPQTSTSSSSQSEIGPPFPYRRLIFNGEVTKLPGGPKVDADFEFHLQKELIPKEEKQPKPDSETPYILQVRRGEEVLSATSPFGVCVSVEDVACYTEKDVSGLFLSQSIDNLQEIPETIVLFYKGREIFRKERSKNNPVVNLIEEENDVSKVHLKWMGEDEDGDTLFYRVFASQDNFQIQDQVYPSFVGTGEKDAMKKTSFDFNFKEHYFAGGNIAFLIVVNDGFNINWTFSKTFNLPSPAYQLKVEIQSPKEDEEIGEGFVILDGNLLTLIHTSERLFSGEPYTWSPIPHADLEWRSNVDGLLAKYNVGDEDFRGVIYCHAESLTPGDHAITLKGKVPSGEAQATVRIKVKSVPGHEYQGKRPNCS